jgi:signal transduction histidine kinase
LKTFVQSRGFAVLAVATALVLLAGAIAFTQAELRTELRQQLARRDGNLFATLLRRHLAADESLIDPVAALLETAHLSELPGLRTLSLYDSRGVFTAAIPATAEETALAETALATARTGATYSHLNLFAELARETILPADERAPLLEVVLPIEDPLGGRAGFARLLLDGAGLAREYRELDDTLRRQAGIAFALAGSAMSLALGFAFYRISSINRRLQTANSELLLAAKTAAIGAVASHLIHGLKNPLAGLQHFVAAQAGPDDRSWSDAAETTRRMRGLIDGVMHLLRDDAFAGQVDVSLRDLLASLPPRLDPLTHSRRVTLRWEHTVDPLLPGHAAGLIALIIENLVTNAVQASSVGQEVCIRTQPTPSGFEIRVTDLGPGLPDHVREHLFTPVQSTKTGGSGLGLALSRQIALSLGASLELVRSSSTGTEFNLSLPCLDTAR